jgi:predicted AlkP superfamily phosphohydrolase/phosphomutase
LRARHFFAVVEDMPTAGVRLNLVGREPHGTVDPADYESTLASLEDGLRELRDEADGQPAIEDLIRTADAYPGPHSDAFADLLVVWRPRPLHAVRSSRVGAVRFRPPPDRSGNHRPGGWFLARGPHIDGDFPTGSVELTELTAAVRALALTG